MMMKDVFIIADNIISPLGGTTGENFEQLLIGNSGIRSHEDESISPTLFYAALFEKKNYYYLQKDPLEFSRFEQLLIASINEATTTSDVNLKDPSTLLIISTTKGNISFLEANNYSVEARKRATLFYSADIIQKYFRAANVPMIVSNACISGLAALIVAHRLLLEGKYKQIVISGADVVSRFVMSGFEAFQAISNYHCKPFDAKRNGINLGEAAATIILTTNKTKNGNLLFLSGAISNDANHISGPSRTGKELALAISKTLKAAHNKASDISFVSAHGTATLYNDEMEAKAFHSAGLCSKPVHSLKSYFGHTLGAAGLVETAVCLQSLRNQTIIPTLGYQNNGLSVPLVIPKQVQKAPLQKIIKTASGFGGCNAAILFSTIQVN